MSPTQVDTLMRQRGYALSDKEVDPGSSSIYYYSNLSSERDILWLRSLSYMDVLVKDLESRIVTYRTYDKSEYECALTFLLSNNYKTSQKFNFKDAQHAIYEKGRQSVRVKATDQQMPDGRPITAYEFEVGK